MYGLCLAVVVVEALVALAVGIVGSLILYRHVRPTAMRQGISGWEHAPVECDTHGHGCGRSSDAVSIVTLARALLRRRCWRKRTR